MDKRWVDEFHSLVDDLAKLSSLDLTGFRVTAAAIKVNDPKFEQYYDRAFVTAKMDGLLGYFELSFPSKKPPPTSQRIGFRPPQ